MARLVSRRVLLATTSALPLLRWLPAWADSARLEAENLKAPPSYTLNVTLDPQKKHLDAEGTLTLAAVNKERTRFRFAIGDTFATGFKIEIRSPREFAGPLTFGPKETFPGSAAVPGTVAAWNVQPRKPIPPNTSVTFAFSYSGGAEPGDVYQLSPEGSVANGDAFPWYPEVIYPGIGNPEVVGIVRYRLIGDEIFLGSSIETTTAEDRSAGFRRFATQHPTGFGFAAGHYHVRQGESGLPVTTYFLSDRPHIQRALPRVSRQMALLQQWYGPYPQGELKIAEAPTKQLFGSGLDGLMFVATALLDRAWEDTFYGHEISHAWWGGKFSVDRYFASEGMANYAALQLIEAMYGAEAARQFRLYGRPGYPEHQSALGYFRIAAAGYDVPLQQHPDNYAETQVNYGKGMLVFDMLKRHLGVDRFNKILRAFMDAYPFKQQTWDFFQSFVSRTAGEDLSWFFTQWFSRVGAPDLAIEWRQRHGSLEIVLKQQGEPYRLDVPVEIEFADGRRASKVLSISERMKSFRLVTSDRIASVEIDPQYTILRWTPELKAFAQAMVPWTKAMMEEKFAAGIGPLKHALNMPRSPDPHGIVFMLRYGLAVLYEKNKQWAESVTAYRAAWNVPHRREDVVPIMLIRMARVAHSANDQKSERWALENALALARRVPPSVLEDEARLELSRLPS